MNEEELKTFEFVKNCLKTGNVEDFQDIDRYDIETLLNLISKLQKKLEQEKEENTILKEIVNKNHETMLDKRYVEMNFISKDKIYDLKQKLLEEGNNLTEEQRQTETEFRQGKLKAYENLLEENINE